MSSTTTPHQKNSSNFFGSDKQGLSPPRHGSGHQPTYKPSSTMFSDEAIQNMSHLLSLSRSNGLSVPVSEIS